ncbi:iron-containing alcohol dehydrogenase [Amycolatopsis carbonis]|uniref:iron-containing alcohol dehydrogenase n=1 Tax=Amycolatopsis carbonis TaxID=715471 RepID=UPI003DA6E7F6
MRPRNLAAEVAELGLGRLLVIADAPAADEVTREVPGRVVARFRDVRPHVPVEVAEAARRAAALHSVDGVVTIGGGSTTGHWQSRRPHHRASAGLRADDVRGLGGDAGLGARRARFANRPGATTACCPAPSSTTRTSRPRCRGRPRCPRRSTRWRTASRRSGHPARIRSLRWWPRKASGCSPPGSARRVRAA